MCTQTYLGVNCTPTTTHTSSYKHSTAKGIIDKCIRNKININGHAIILGKGSEKKVSGCFGDQGNPLRVIISQNIIHIDIIVKKEHYYSLPKLKK